MNAWTGAIALVLGSTLALAGAGDALASCPGGAAHTYGAEGYAACPVPQQATRGDQVDPRAGGVAGVVDAAPAGLLAMAANASAALGPAYAVVDEWVGGEIFYGVLTEVAPESAGADAGDAGDAGIAVLQTVQRLPSNEAAARFFPIVAAAPPSDLSVLVQESIDTEQLAAAQAAQQDADELQVAARVLASDGKDGRTITGLVAVARKDAYIVSVEVRGTEGGGGAALGPRLVQLLRALLTRLPG